MDTYDKAVEAGDISPQDAYAGKKAIAEFGGWFKNLSLEEKKEFIEISEMLNKIRGVNGKAR